MGVSSALGYRYGGPNRLRRWLGGFAQTRGGADLSRRIMPVLDRFVVRMSGSRLSATGLLTGIPALWVTTTGRKTGEPRTVALLGIPIDDDLALIGTSFGQHDTPAWVLNLESEPAAVVSYRSKTVSVQAREPDPTTEARIWEQARIVYPGFANYPIWAAHRRIRVFILRLDQV
jgi:deazaflavin-dependent oxidoreductase (nitroreductase family)